MEKKPVKKIAATKTTMIITIDGLICGPGLGWAAAQGISSARRASKSREMLPCFAVQGRLCRLRIGRV
ncbi:hypothetical protein SLA2020_439930 [Shorea laevis]